MMMSSHVSKDTPVSSGDLEYQMAMSDELQQRSHSFNIRTRGLSQNWHTALSQGLSTSLLNEEGRRGRVAQRAERLSTDT